MQIGIGIGIDGSTRSRTPAQLSTAPALWVSARSNTLYTKASVLAGNGDPVRTWLRPGDSLASPAFRYGIQTTDADSPAAVLSSGRYYLDGGSSDFFALNSAVAATGDFSAWFIGKVALNSILVFLASASGADSIQINGGTTYVQSSSNTCAGAYSGSAGLSLFQVTRASGTVTFRSTGVASVSFGTLVGTCTFDNLMARTGSFPAFTTSDNWLNEAAVMLGTVTAADNRLMENYLLQISGLKF